MKKLLNSAKAWLSEYQQKQAQYSLDGNEWIARNNLRILFRGSLATVVFLLLFILITPLIIKGWRASAYHLSFIPASFSVFLFSLILQKQKTVSNHLVTRVCILFECVLYLFIILIDTAGTPERPASFMPVILVAVPAIFTMPYKISFGLPFLFEVVYILAVLHFKHSGLEMYDIFSSLFGLACSICVSGLIMSLRLRDFAYQMKYKQLSTLDSLSAIYNKSASRQACEKYLEAEGEAVVCTLLILDLDDFKGINDTRGHIAGDTVLRCMGEILLANFRHSDIVGRFGGDEFIVLVKGTSSYAHIARKCEMIQKELQRISREKIGIETSCSIGAALLHCGSRSFNSLVEEADAALYAAKKRGKAGYKIRHCH